MQPIAKEELIANVERKFIDLPLIRLGVANIKLLPCSPNLSPSAITLQIELRERMLKDIRLIRVRLRRSRPGTNGRSFRAVYYSGALGHPTRTYSRAIKCRHR